ncbi:MAG: ATP-binding protein [Mucilaginibacter sp.]|uniref:tetratricopeptide repeat-containing sensor histidine kinase n=1 Tax=Mucilaginibacter sp. TaxID=1882438 RepID=UPI003264AF50
MPYITGNYHLTGKHRLTFIYLIWCVLFFALSSCEKKHSPNPANKTTKFIDTANRLYDISPAKGIHYIDSVIANQKNVDVGDKFEFYRLHSYYHYVTTHNYEKALLYADSLEALIEATHNEKKYAKQYGIAAFSKGDLLFALNRFPEAYKYYYKGRIIGRNNFDSCTIGDYSYHMGMIMYKQEHYQLAASHFLQSFEENKNCNDNFATFYRSQELLDNVALSYKKTFMPNHAEVYYNKALKFIDSHASKYPDKANTIEVARSVVYGNLAKIYLERKDFAKAEVLLKKSIATNLKPGNDNRDAQLTELTLAHLYVDQKKPELMLFDLLQNIRIQLDSVKNIDAEVDWNHLMAGYYQRKNDLKKSVQYFNAFDAMKDSVTKATLKLKESDVNQQFKDLENQSTISTLKSDNKLQHTYLIIALVYAVMALIIILLVFLNWKRSKHNVKMLSELNVTVTEQKQQLERSLIELEDNGKEKDRILRAVSHDLRNPIGGIASLTAMMLMEPGLDSEQVELLQLIQSTTNNSLELINEILEATGVLSSKTSTRQYVDINLLLSHSVELLKFKAAEKNQKIMLHVLESPEELYISREKIWRVFSNLISNAIKFSPQGAVISAEITIENGDIQIAVNDHGIGIPDEIKDEVFQMFTEAKRPGTAGEKSFGLGLSICKQIIESHNGEIWFDSDPIKGTTFYIRLKKQKV